MNRSAFADWGADLDAARFACALAALGVLQAHGRTPLAPMEQEEIVGYLRGIQAEHAILRCRCYLPSRDAVEPAVLADSWMEFVHGRYDDAPRMALENFESRLDAFWVLEQLSHDEVNAAGIWVESEALGGTRRWHWPLRVGMLGDIASRELQQEMRSLGKYFETRPLVNFVEMGEARGECDLLLLPHDQRGALAAVLGSSSRPRALAVLVFGQREGSYLEAGVRLGVLQMELAANAAILAAVPQAERTEWFLEVVRELAHNNSLDVALRRAAQRRKTVAPLTLAHAGWLQETKLSYIARSLATKMMHPAVSIAPFPPGGRQLLSSQPSPSLGEIGRTLAANVDFYHFARESDEATEIAGLVTEAGPLLRHVPPEVPARRVQARVFLRRGKDESGDGGKELLLERAFASDAWHRVECRIGAELAGWISSSEPFPQEQLPPSEKGHTLHVILTEPNLLAEPRIDTIFLPAAGNSESCVFYLRTRADSTRIEARLTITYRSRVLQTTTIEAKVVKDLREAPESMRILVRPEVIVSPGMADLDSQSEYGAALVFNKTGDGRATLTKIVEDNAEFITIDDQKVFAAKISDRLNECDWAAPEFAALDATGTVSLLCELARNGSMLYSNVVKRQFRDQALAQASRIQVIAARPEARFPVEYFYEFPSPAANATLCERAAEALSAKSGKCVDCPYKVKTGERVCPAGFWGLNRVIEWHLFRPEARREMTNADFVLQQEKMRIKKRLVPLHAAVASASELVDKGVPGSFDTVVAALQKAIPKGKVGSPKTWDEWKQCIGALSPSLLMLIPHVDEDQQHFQTLEINGDHLAVDHIVEDCVRNPQRPTFPIVFLLGCETGVSEVTFMGFLSKFCEHKPAVVVSTWCRILGRQAALLAAEFIEVLQQAHGSEVTFGDVMLTVRRRMLNKGLPMVLAVSSYGDADWRLV